MAAYTRCRLACGVWVEDWKDCHKIASKQPEERTELEVELITTWLRVRIPILKYLSEGDL